MRVLMVVLAVSGHLCLAELSREDRLEMIQRDLTTFSEFKYGRYFNIEDMTCQYVRGLSENVDLMKLLRDNLRLLLDSLYDRYYLVKGAVKGTDAERCLTGLAEKYDKLSEQDIGGMDTCISIALMRQSKFEDKLSKVMAEYSEHNDHVLDGLEMCLMKFPNKKSNEAWEQCYKLQYDRFIRNYDEKLQTYHDSPCMENFLSSYLPCFLKRFDNVKKTSTDLIVKLDSCIAIAKLDIPPVKVALDSTNILPRIKHIQNIYKEIKGNVTSSLLHYYEIEKKAWQTPVLSPESKSNDHFYDELVHEFSDYFKAINQTMRDNPSDAHVTCGFDAVERLQELFHQESNEMETCHDGSVGGIFNGIEYVRRQFSEVMQQFPGVSNIAILDCLTKVYMFGNDTIEECYDLEKRSFELEWEYTLRNAEEMIVAVNQAVQQRNGFCGERSRRSLTLEADRTLFDYRRCLAKATTGDPGPIDYPVTTPSRPTYPAAPRYVEPLHTVS